MVNTGLPSRDCYTCRRRRVKVCSRRLLQRVRMWSKVANEVPSATCAVQVAIGVKRSGRNALGTVTWRIAGWFSGFTPRLRMLLVSSERRVNDPASRVRSSPTPTKIILWRPSMLTGLSKATQRSG